MTYLWAYVEGMAYDPVCDEDWTEDSAPVLLPVSYEVDLWGDDVRHVMRPHELMSKTTDNRTFKLVHLNRQVEVETWSCTCEACLDERALVKRWGSSHVTWKNARRHQWKGSARV